MSRTHPLWAGEAPCVRRWVWRCFLEPVIRCSGEHQSSFGIGALDSLPAACPRLQPSLPPMRRNSPYAFSGRSTTPGPHEETSSKFWGTPCSQNDRPLAPFVPPGPGGWTEMITVPLLAPAGVCGTGRRAAVAGHTRLGKAMRAPAWWPSMPPAVTRSLMGGGARSCCPGQGRPSVVRRDCPSAGDEK